MVPNERQYGTSIASTQEASVFPKNIAEVARHLASSRAWRLRLFANEAARFAESCEACERAGQHDAAVLYLAAIGELMEHDELAAEEILRISLSGL
jgi:hypothetical protein